MGGLPGGTGGRGLDRKVGSGFDSQPIETFSAVGSGEDLPRTQWIIGTEDFVAVDFPIVDRFLEARLGTVAFEKLDVVDQDQRRKEIHHGSQDFPREFMPRIRTGSVIDFFQ